MKDQLVLIKQILKEQYCQNSFGNYGSYKYFIGYIYEGTDLPSPSCLKLSQSNTYVKYFDKNSENMNFLDKEILGKYNKIKLNEIKLKIYSIKNLKVNQCIMINT